MRRSGVPVLVAIALLVGSCSSDTRDGGVTDGGEVAASVDLPTTTVAVDTAATTLVPTTTVQSQQTFSERGPYQVGVRTISLGDRETEVWYPATSDGGATEIFDSLSVFPEEFKAFIPPELQGTLDTGAYRDAPIVDGLYPVVVYSHGFGGFRQVATKLTTHLASWGFIVVSTDHIERDIRAQSRATAGQAGDTSAPDNQDEIDILDSIVAIGESDLGANADLDRVAVSGHSAGAFAAAAVAADDLIDAYVTISGARPESPVFKPALIIAAELDGVVPASRSEELFEALDDNPLTYYLNIAGAGHNSFTDSCERILALGGLGALTDLIGPEQVSRGEEGCTENFADPGAVLAAVGHYMTAFLFTVLGDGSDGASMEQRDDLGVEFADFVTTDNKN